ncbi:MAG: hypothetical protein L3J08_09430 [Flavobacteriaceae bacterium]|nr:hypothetical protein [Flavobacteriaceae bacterium]
MTLIIWQTLRNTLVSFFICLSLPLFAQNNSAKILLSETSTIKLPGRPGYCIGGGKILNSSGAKLFSFYFEISGFSTKLSYRGYSNYDFNKLKFKIETSDWRPESRVNNIKLQNKKVIELSLPRPENVNFLSKRGKSEFISVYENDYLEVSIRLIKATEGNSKKHFNSLEIEVIVEQTKYLSSNKTGIKTKCKHCNGEGKIWFPETQIKCNRCDGTGKIRYTRRGGLYKCEPPMGSCNGTGKITVTAHWSKCLDCNGVGTIIK